MEDGHIVGELAFFLGWQDPFVTDTAGLDLVPILPLLVSYFSCIADVIQFVG